MSSPEAATKTTSATEPLPPAWSSMWRLCRLGYTHEPRLVVAVVALTLLAALPDAFFALWLAVLGGALIAGDTTLVWVMVGAIAVSGTLTWLLTVLSDRLTRRFRDRVTIALETHIARLQASVVGLEHHERSDYLDRLAVLRTQVFVLDHMYMSLLSTIGWIVRVGVTVALLASISPLLILLVVFAVPPVLSSTWRPAVERAVEERYARHSRLAEHLFALGTSAPPGKEVRVTGIGAELPARRRTEWSLWFAPVARARWVTAATHVVAWAIFGLGYVAAVVYVAVGLAAGPAAVLLILAAGARLSSYVGRDHGRDRLPARRLAGRFAPARLVGDLRRRSAGHRRRRRPGPAGARAPARPGVVRLPGHRPAGARRRQPHHPARYGRRRRRRERRRQVHPGQAAGEDVRAERRGDLRRRRAARPDARQRLAGAAHRSVPGLLPLRVRRPTQCRARRPRAPRRPGHRARSRSAGRRPRRRRTSPRRLGHPARPDLARRTGAELRAVAEARPRPRLHAHRAAADDLGRADRGAGRRDRARAVRALRRGRAQHEGRRHHDLGLPPLQHGALRRSDRGAGRVPAGRGRAVTTTCSGRAAPTPSCTGSRLRRTRPRFPEQDCQVR